MTYLFTVIAFFAVGGIAWFARQQHSSTDNIEIDAKQIRHELRVIAYLLAGVVILLGVIADKIQ